MRLIKKTRNHLFLIEDKIIIDFPQQNHTDEDGRTRVYQTHLGWRNGAVRLLSRYLWPSYLTLVQQMVSNREDAEDITQDIFVKAYESLKRYRGDCEFITWIYRIACNVTASILRKNKQRQEYLSFDGNIPEHIGNDESEIPFDIIDENEPDERIEDLQLAISWLSAEERALITLFYYENKSIEDCAYILQQSEGNIKVRLHRVRKKIIFISLSHQIWKRTDIMI